MSTKKLEKDGEKDRDVSGKEAQNKSSETPTPIGPNAVKNRLEERIASVDADRRAHQNGQKTKETADQVLMKHRIRRNDLRKSMRAAVSMLPVDQRSPLFAMVLIQQSASAKRSQAALGLVNPSSSAALAIMTDLIETRTFNQEVIEMSNDRSAPEAMAATLAAAEARVLEMGGQDLLDQATKRNRPGRRNNETSRDESGED